MKAFPEARFYNEYPLPEYVVFELPNPISYMELGKLVGIFGTSQIEVEGWGRGDDEDTEEGLTVTVKQVLFGEGV